MARKLIDIDALLGEPIVVRIGGQDYPVEELNTEEYLRLIRLTGEAERRGVVELNEAIIEQAKRLVPTFPWGERPMPVAGVFAIVKEVAAELGEARTPALVITVPSKKGQ